MIFLLKKVLSVKLIVLNMAHQVVKKRQLRVGLRKFYPYVFLVGLLTRRGQRRRALRLVAQIFLHIRKQYRVHPLLFLQLFSEKFRPKVFLYGKKIAGVTHKIPVPISYRKSVSVLFHWWLHLARKNQRGRSFLQAFLLELDNAYRLPVSPLSKKRDEVHRLAHLNRPFLRYLRF
jgi:ribosomal protein S7